MSALMRIVRARPDAEAARRLWAGERVETDSPEAVVAAIEHVGVRLRLGLGRWIGFYGYGVLLARVLEETVTEHPALRGVRLLPDGKAGGAGMIPAHEVPALIRGFISVVARLIHRLSEVIGDDLAMRLVEQAWKARGASDV